jgi:hypothetical protein
MALLAGRHGGVGVDPQAGQRQQADREGENGVAHDKASTRADFMERTKTRSERRWRRRGDFWLSGCREGLEVVSGLPRRSGKPFSVALADSVTPFMRMVVIGASPV